MGISHQRTWKKHGCCLWRARNSSTIGGTVCGEAEQQNYGPQEHEANSSCSLAGGSRRQWRDTAQSRSILGNLWNEESSWCRYVEKMDIASYMVTGPPSSRGQHGYEKSSAIWRQRHMRTAKFWVRLDRPPEKVEGPE